MRYKRLDLNLLMALRALLAEKSVTRAGESLHISQPAMSGMLSRLRDYFEDPLIVQYGRELKLTPLARSLVEPVNDALLHIDLAIATRVDSDPATAERRFVVAASDYSISTVLQIVMQKLERQAPNIGMEIRPPGETMLSDLENGTIDFVLTPKHFLSEKCECAELWRDGFTIVASQGNDAVGARMALDQYQAMRHAVYRTNDESQGFFEHWYDETYGTESRNVAIGATGFFQLSSLVVNSDNMIATLPSKLASQFSKWLPIKLSKPDFEIPDLVQYLQWHRYQELDPVACWLRDEILSRSAKLWATRQPA